MGLDPSGFTPDRACQLANSKTMRRVHYGFRTLTTEDQPILLNTECQLTSKSKAVREHQLDQEMSNFAEDQTNKEHMHAALFRDVRLVSLKANDAIVPLPAFANKLPDCECDTKVHW